MRFFFLTILKVVILGDVIVMVQTTNICEYPTKSSIGHALKTLLSFQAKSRSLVCLAAASAVDLAGHSLMTDHARSGNNLHLTPSSLVHMGNYSGSRDKDNVHSILANFKALGQAKASI